MSINTVLRLGVLGAVLGLGSSSALAGAYGIAVTLTMLINPVLTWFVVRGAWHLPVPLAAFATAGFLLIEALRAGADLTRLTDRPRPVRVRTAWTRRASVQRDAAGRQRSA